jgi:hypothetical protein
MVIYTQKVYESDEIRGRSSNFVTLRKTKFQDLGIVPGQNDLGQFQGPFCIDFNAGKKYVVVLTLSRRLPKDSPIGLKICIWAGKK